MEEWALVNIRQESVDFDSTGRECISGIGKDALQVGMIVNGEQVYNVDKLALMLERKGRSRGISDHFLHSHRC